MPETFFISDTHFGHEKIISFESVFRPFSTIQEHDEELVYRWNSTVGPNDKVFCLGDFAFGKEALQIAGRLNGDKRLVMGNHDIMPTQEYTKYFTKLYGAFKYNKLLLTHIPVLPDEPGRWKANVHGHLHSRVIANRWYINVSCEQINLTPVPYEYLVERLPKE